MPAYISIGADVNRTLTVDSRMILEKEFPTIATVVEMIGGGGAAVRPDWATGAPTWTSPVYNRESPQMVGVRAAIRDALLGRADFEILTVGDSKTRFPGVVSWAEQLRRMLGAVDGFIVADDGVTDARWSVTGFQVPDAVEIGVTPISGATSRSATFTSTEPHTGAVVWVRAVSGAAVTVTVDGASQVVNLPAADTWQQVDVGALADAPHSITVTTSDTVRVLGVTLTYPGPRLKLSNPSRAASGATDWVPGAGAAIRRWQSVIDGPTTSPGVIFAAIGTNQITDLATHSTFFDALHTLGVPVVVVAPGAIDFSRGDADTDALQAHLAGIATANDWPLIDFESVVGKFATANAAGLMKDGVHENTRGAYLEALAVQELIA